jgi:signal transduction histidine kinase
VAVFARVRRNGRLTGLLAGYVALDSRDVLDALREAASFSHTGHAVLVDRGGQALAATMPLQFLSPAEHPSFYRRVVAAKVPVEASVVVEGNEPTHGDERHIMAVAPLRVTTWAVAVGGDEEDVMAGVTHLRLGLGLVGAIALATAWSITIFGTRRLVRPVQRLTEAAERIAAGDLDTPLTVPEGGEIGAMAAALDSMRKLLLESITDLAGWNEALEARVLDRTLALRQEQTRTRGLLRRVITAQEEERGRLSADLHDGIGQSLAGVQLSIDRAAKSLSAAEPIAARRLYESRALVDQALQDLRRMIAALRPGILDQLGLLPALRWVGDHTLRPNGIAVTVEEVGLGRRLPRDIETILFRIGQEAMSNVVRHSGARNFRVRIVWRDARVRMTLTDDGRGFDPAAVAGSPDPQRGLGLAGMNERASAAGGGVVVKSAAGGGTEVQVVIPVADLDGSEES